MSTSLPERTDLEQLRRQAKELRDAAARRSRAFTRPVTVANAMAERPAPCGWPGTAETAEAFVIGTRRLELASVSVAGNPNAIAAIVKANR